MVKPVLIVVDDDQQVLQAIARDLRRHYGMRFRVLHVSSGNAALTLLQKLRQRDEPVALILADQRMPQMTGVALLEAARRENLYPSAKRVLLTAYADTAAAIQAINSAQVDYYLLKPWDPPEERLFPVLDDLLDDWLAGYRPPFAGVRVVGTRWSPTSHEIKDFLARNYVPYQWLDVERSEEARRLAEGAGEDKRQFPLIVLPDGARLSAPTTMQVAEKIGLKTRAGGAFYDLIIVGAGPAGLAAAVYGASEGLRTVMIERQAPGGQAGQSSRIENYLGFPAGLSGADLARRAVAQASRFGVEVLTPQEATGLRVDGPCRGVLLADGTLLRGHVLLIACGVAYRRLAVPGIERLTGCGVYYGAAMTEAFECRGEDVFIVGGANSAGQAAMYFARYARTVTMLTRSSLSKSMSQYLIDQIAATPNILVRTGTSVVEAHGMSHLEAITIADTSTGTRQTVPANALFILIGAFPHTDWLDGTVARDASGFILTGPDLMRDGRRPQCWTADRDPYLLESSVPGIFAVGDVRHGAVHRVASAVGEGSVAVSFVHQYLRTV